MEPNDQESAITALTLQACAFPLLGLYLPVGWRRWTDPLDAPNQEHQRSVQDQEPRLENFMVHLPREKSSSLRSGPLTVGPPQRRRPVEASLGGPASDGEEDPSLWGPQLQASGLQSYTESPLRDSMCLGPASQPPPATVPFSKPPNSIGTEKKKKKSSPLQDPWDWPQGW